MPDPITETRLPLYSPVNPSIFLVELNWLTPVKNSSAIYFALKGSPGSKTVSAISPTFAPICGVGTLLSPILQTSFYIIFYI
jgi:hypothetical protein